jgi:uncharacterized membrane protein required for colicin V production
MRNPDKEFELGDLSVIDTSNPYRAPRSSHFNQSIDLRKLNSHRNTLMVLFCLTILVSFIPFVLIRMGIASDISALMYLIGSFVSFFLGIGTLIYIYVVNTYMGSNGQALFVTLIALIPVFGLYIALRTMILSKKLLK